MARFVTFLQLAPEFGGTKFGPFEAVEIRLGSDPGSNDITLPETLGVAAQHVKLLRQQDNSFILAPVDRAAPVFHFRAGTARSKQVTAPMAVQGGDSFALVTPEGPRFHIVVETDPRAIKSASADAEGPEAAILKRLQPSAQRLGGGIAAEIKRRGLAAVFTTKIGAFGMRAWTMLKTGAIFSPLYIVSGMLMLSGWLFAGGAACSTFRLHKTRTDVSSKLSECNDKLGVATQEDGGAAEISVPQLANILLEEENWDDSLSGDPELYKEFATALREIFGEPARYKWVYSQKSSHFTSFRRSLDSNGASQPLSRVLSFAAASPNADRDWTRVNDSEGKDVCGRGPLGLTYRQAYNLGLTTLQPDALVERQMAESADVAKQREALEATLKEAGATYEFRDDLIKSVGAELQGGLMCLYVDGEDDRTNLSAIADAMMNKVGSKVTKTLPKEQESHWVSSRLVMAYAHDFKAYELSELKFDRTTGPSTQMSSRNVAPGRAAFAIREAARVMARAAAVPCLARFDKEQKTFPTWFLQKEPLFFSCATLRVYVEYDRL
jgi:hypothetical protein